MTEPRVEDYNLNEKKIQILEVKENRFNNGLMIVHGLLFVTALFLFLNSVYPFKDIITFILFLVIGLFISGAAGISSMIFIGIPCSLLYDTFNKDKKNRESFEKALKAYKGWDYRNKEEYWKRMSGFVYEKEVSKLFLKKGYDVTTTKSTGDGGVDITLQKDGKLVIVQCKNTQKPAGPAIVRDLYGTMINFNAHEAILVSTSGCSKGASEFIVGKPISIIDLASLIEMNK
jgi:hypothetical protein